MGNVIYWSLPYQSPTSGGAVEQNLGRVGLGINRGPWTAWAWGRRRQKQNGAAVESGEVAAFRGRPSQCPWPVDYCSSQVCKPARVAMRAANTGRRRETQRWVRCESIKAKSWLAHQVTSSLSIEQTARCTCLVTALCVDPCWYDAGNKLFSLSYPLCRLSMVFIVQIAIADTDIHSVNGHIHSGVCGFSSALNLIETFLPWMLTFRRKF